MKLNARQIETAKPKEKSYKLADGAGLYLEITPRGSKYWRMKYHRPTDKKEDRLAFGVYPVVSLADTRAKRDEAKAEKKTHKLNQRGHIPLNGSPVNGTPIINGGAKVYWQNNRNLRRR